MIFLDSTIELVEIGVLQLPSIMSPGASTQLGSFICYGTDALFYGNVQTYRNAGADYNAAFMSRVRRDGTSMTWQSPDWIYTGISFQGQGCLPLNNTNTLMIAAGDFGAGRQIITVPVEFQAGAAWIFTPTVFDVPAPCGVGALTQTYSFPQYNLVAYEFVDPFADDSFIYAAIYRYTLAGESLVNGGFIGVFPTGQNGFDQTNLTLPPGIQLTGNSAGADSAFYQRGTWFYDSSEGDGPDFYVGFASIDLVQQGTLSCAAPNTGTYVVGTGQQIIAQNPAPYAPGFDYGTRESGGSGYSQIDGVYILTGYGFETAPYTGFRIFSADFILNFHVTGMGAGRYPKTGVLFSDGYAMFLEDVATQNGGYGVRIYGAQIPQSLLAINPDVQQLQYVLTNYNKPISVTGAYKP